MAERPSSIVVQAWAQVKAGAPRAGGIRNERQREPGSLIGPCLSRESEGFFFFVFWARELVAQAGREAGGGRFKWMYQQCRPLKVRTGMFIVAGWALIGKIGWCINKTGK